MGNLVVDIGSPELYTHAYSTLEVFRIEALGTLDKVEFIEFGSKGQTVFFFQYTSFFTSATLLRRFWRVRELPC